MVSAVVSAVSSAASPATLSGGVGSLGALKIGEAVLSDSLLNLAGTGLKGLGILGVIQSGRTQAASLEASARQQEIAANQELINAKKTTNFIQKQLLEDLSAQNAAFAARGILSSSGSAQAAAFRSAQNATRDIETARFGSRLRSSQSRGRASLLRSQASDAKASGLLQAGTLAAGSFL